MNPPFHESTNEQSELARKRLLGGPREPLFYADWDRALFMHYEIAAERLQPDVPFLLDLRDGKAYVSLVAFTMRGMRFRFGGIAGKRLCRPFGTHAFLNVRTYVRHRGDAGIYFLTEWLPNKLCVLVGPRTYGLPYRPAQIRYDHRHEQGSLAGEVFGRGGCFSYSARISRPVFRTCARDSLDEFLLERYTAFTCRKGKRRFFRIWHEPWEQAAAEVAVSDDALLRSTWHWFGNAKPVSASYSPCARNVWMGWPHRIRKTTRQRNSVLAGFFEMP